MFFSLFLLKFTVFCKKYAFFAFLSIFCYFHCFLLKSLKISKNHFFPLFRKTRFSLKWPFLAKFWAPGTIFLEKSKSDFSKKKHADSHRAKIVFFRFMKETHHLGRFLTPFLVIFDLWGTQKNLLLPIKSTLFWTPFLTPFWTPKMAIFWDPPKIRLFVNLGFFQKLRFFANLPFFHNFHDFSCFFLILAKFRVFTTFLVLFMPYPKNS